MPTFHEGTAVSVVGGCNACCTETVPISCCDPGVDWPSTLYLTLSNPDGGDPACLFGVAIPLIATPDTDAIGGTSWQAVNYSCGGYYLFVRVQPCHEGCAEPWIEAGYASTPYPWSPPTFPKAGGGCMVDGEDTCSGVFDYRRNPLGFGWGAHATVTS